MDNIRAYGKGCIGCKEAKKPIMVACQRAGSLEFEEYFLTTEQAEALVKELTERLIQNRRED